MRLISCEEDEMTPKRICIIGSLLLILVSLSACGPNQIKVDENQSGNNVQLKVGETLLVTLDSNPTTGYSWELSQSDESVLEQKGEAEYKQAPGSQGLIGAGGKETFRFEAVGAGQTTLELIYHRPWEQGVPPVKTYSLEVTVK
jgi:inhibitor of cysteine peptidase